jgi:hypothetical protein
MRRYRPLVNRYRNCFRVPAPGNKRQERQAPPDWWAPLRHPWTVYHGFGCLGFRLGLGLGFRQGFNRWLYFFGF